MPLLSPSLSESQKEKSSTHTPAPSKVKTRRSVPTAATVTAASAPETGGAEGAVARQRTEVADAHAAVPQA